MTEERAPYDSSSPDPDHQHHFQFVASNKHVIRYCDRCGRSWMIGEIRNIVNNRTLPCWTEILEEDAAWEKLTQ
jgi:hypothetical protein